MVFLRIVGVTAAVVALGCGTTVKSANLAASGSATAYSVGACEVGDDRATADTCTALKERVEYGLLSSQMLAADGAATSRQVNLKITYFRNLGGVTRAVFGVLSGKDGMTVQVSVVEGTPPSETGSAQVSNFNYLAIDFTEDMMVGETATKIVEFLRAGKTE